ncbi:MAG TPA: nucleotidyltransferase family protein [Methylococcaceae bacterium]|jgi:MurNAc alpha-1-phosphate uridylyltransferase|nr:nucleotidyltransferase family protein [Methylococcaceae bacterium]HIN68556.1 nucleotidyltransferase family protein [Methylococcales bacterium]HIA45553.1 nucleotidyltransferase family protein [Methylococcaceae bacterium]HIB62837.1 nucleotidyltransferase family protein [Methylococcaceae bacterium]HIO12195.1 nucleotidyltransferase family protein [Methylococcales bacterium]
MKAMILAAGRGERLRPLTDKQPKPLLPIAGKPLIEYTIERLVSAGFQDLVINIAYLGTQIKDTLGNGHRFNAKISYSDEGSNPLETAGGIIHALPLLGNKPFIVINGDIATDFNFSTLKEKTIDLAHLILVPNPKHHPQGDFGIKDNLITENNSTRYTFSGIGLYHPKLFNHQPPGKSALKPLLQAGIQEKGISGELNHDFWLDIGTIERLNNFEKHVKKNPVMF